MITFPLTFLRSPKIIVPGLTSGAGVSFRNNYGDYVGFQFTPTANMHVTHLGRWKVSGNTGTHTVKIAPVSSAGTVLASASIDLTLFSAGDYAYVQLPTPVALSAGTAYGIGTLEVISGDQWYDQFDVTWASGLSSVTALFQSGGAWNVSTVNRAFGPPNFKYTIP